MNNSLLYHRQCFRQQENAGSVTDVDVGFESSADITADVVHNDNDCDDKAALTEADISTSSVLKSNDTPLVSSASIVDSTSPLISSSLDKPMPASSVLSHPPLDTVEQSSMKHSVDQVSINSFAPASADATDDTSERKAAQCSSRPADSSTLQHDDVGVSQTSTTATVDQTKIQTDDLTPVEVVVLVEKLPVSSHCGLQVAPNQMESAVNGKSEEMLNTVEHETGKKKPLEKLAENSSRSASGVHTSSSSSSAALASVKHRARSATEDGDMSVQMPVSAVEFYHQPSAVADVTSHSASVDVIQTVLPSSTASQPAVKLPSRTTSHDVSVTMPTAAVAQSSPESSTVDCRKVKGCSRRPAPLPPREPLHDTAGHKRLTSVMLCGSEHVSTAVKLTHDLTHSTQSQQQTTSKNSEEQLPAVASHNGPKPTARQRHLPKPKVPATDAGMCPADVSEGPAITKVATDNTGNTSSALKRSPVAKPRKHSQSVLEVAEVVGIGTSAVTVKRGDADSSLAAKLKADNNVVTDSGMSSVGDVEPEVSSFPLNCEGSKSPSLSPSLLVKYPRSKKRFAAPAPPRPAPPATKSEDSHPHIAAITKPQMAESHQQLGSCGSRSPYSANDLAHSLTDVPEHSGTSDVKPVRKKISPGVKFTFEKDVFRPTKTPDVLAAEHLKPSRPAPPRPYAADAKRKVSCHVCTFSM